MVGFSSLGSNSDYSTMSEHPVGEVVHTIACLSSENAVSCCADGVVVESVQQVVEGLELKVPVVVGDRESVLGGCCCRTAFKVECLVLRSNLKLLCRDIGLVGVHVDISSATVFGMPIGLISKMVALGLIVVCLVAPAR